MDNYLAQKYLSSAKGDLLRERKKKKRKVDHHQEGALAIIDNEAGSWANQDIEDDEDKGMIVESRAKAAFKPVNAMAQRKKSPSPVNEEDQPTVVKLQGGLQSASQLAEETRRRQKQEEKQKQKVLREAEERRLAAVEAGQDLEELDETIHRDASGRARDTKRERVEAKRRARDEVEKDAQKMKWGKGLVQREDRERRRREEEDMAARPVARFVDDQDLNREQKEVMRWNDPSAQFLTKANKSKAARPVYRGPVPPPNRFGIKPGYRWDGVDRGNGFEKQYLQRDNENKRRNLEAYKYGAEDM